MKKKPTTKPAQTKTKPAMKARPLHAPMGDASDQASTSASERAIAAKHAKAMSDTDKAIAHAKVELAKPVKAAKTKDVPTDDGMLSVSDVARELNIDPKHLRAKLRKSGASADGGRWPKVKRGSKEHKALVELATTDE